MKFLTLISLATLSLTAQTIQLPALPGIPAITATAKKSSLVYATKASFTFAHSEYPAQIKSKRRRRLVQTASYTIGTYCVYLVAKTSKNK